MTALANLNAELAAQGLALYVAEDPTNDWDYTVYLSKHERKNSPPLNIRLRPLRCKSVAAVRRYLTHEHLQDLDLFAAEIWGISIYSDKQTN